MRGQRVAESACRCWNPAVWLLVSLLGSIVLVAVSVLLRLGDMKISRRALTPTVGPGAAPTPNTHTGIGLFSRQRGSSPPPCFSTGTQRASPLPPIFLIVNAANYVKKGNWPSRKYPGLCQNAPRESSPNLITSHYCRARAQCGDGVNAARCIKEATRCQVLRRYSLMRICRMAQDRRCFAVAVLHVQAGRVIAVSEYSLTEAGLWYTEEEIRQKVSTFRQMLMDKEGVITREGSHTQPVVNHLHYQPDGYEEDPELVAYEDGGYDHDYHSDNRVKRKSSSSPSPRPKKRKKKKSGRQKERFGSSSPTHREKKKKSGKKHKRDRSASGSRKKRRYRSGSPKNKHKDKNKQKKRSPGETPGRSSQRQGSCCSSRSASLSSTRSTSKSPARLNSKHKTDGQKASGTSLSPGTNTPAAWHNGDHTQQRSRNGKAGRLNHGEGEKGHDKLRLLTASSAGVQSALLREHRLHSAPSRSQAGQMCAAGEAGSVDGRSAAVGNSVTQTSGRRGSQRGQNKTSHSPAHSSDSAHSQHNHTHRGRSSRHQRKTKGGHSSKRHHRSSRGQAHHRSPSASPGRHPHTSGRKKEESRSRPDVRQRSSSWSSGHSSSRSASRDRGPSKAKSPHNRQNNSRERDSPNRSDTDSRARRRSRSYSPIRKRRRDSPSFMEARRITSARKRPIPYYRPSPSSSSYDSSPSRSSRSRSRSYSSYSRSRSHSRSHNRSHSRSRSRSRSWSRSRSQSRSWSRSRSRSRSKHSYYSRSSYDSPGF
ncbi:serine/arginine repetitive matrix protein 3 [Plectropomus leopardus]|uniref:serine/arginine repetitive matrix protein 3 n=1 Tax=Plectropomus leopardus TaxID=160734 RepID=UPI001C4A853F|nr:serine/arginine repetitive matrix protein 3 [Plectropomus leopardus]